jgi:hypothetical protein
MMKSMLDAQQSHAAEACKDKQQQGQCHDRQEVIEFHGFQQQMADAALRSEHLAN